MICVLAYAHYGPYKNIILCLKTFTFNYVNETINCFYEKKMDFKAEIKVNYWYKVFFATVFNKHILLKV